MARTFEASAEFVGAKQRRRRLPRTKSEILLLSISLTFMWSPVFYGGQERVDTDAPVSNAGEMDTPIRARPTHTDPQEVSLTIPFRIRSLIKKH